MRLNVDILIHRPIQDVFSFLVRWENASLWNSAVRRVTKTSDGPVGVGTEYWMSRELPQGEVENTFKVIEYEPNRRYSIQTTSGPTPFLDSILVSIRVRPRRERHPDFVVRRRKVRWHCGCALPDCIHRGEERSGGEPPHAQGSSRIADLTASLAGRRVVLRLPSVLSIKL